MNDHLNTRTQRHAYQTRIQALEGRVGRLVEELARALETCDLQRATLADKDRAIARAHVALREIRDHCRRQERHCEIDAIAGAVLDERSDAWKALADK